MLLYVIGPATGPVKIGISGAAVVRLRALQTGHPRKLFIHAEVPGGEAEEQHVHWFLASSKLEGEWFDRTDEVNRFIALLSERVPVRTAIARLADRREVQARLRSARGRKKGSVKKAKKLPMKLATVFGESVENGV